MVLIFVYAADCGKRRVAADLELLPPRQNVGTLSPGGYFFWEKRIASRAGGWSIRKRSIFRRRAARRPADRRGEAHRGGGRNLESRHRSPRQNPDTKCRHGGNNSAVARHCTTLYRVNRSPRVSGKAISVRLSPSAYEMPDGMTMPAILRDTATWSESIRP